METLIVFFWKVKDEWNAKNYATLQKKNPYMNLSTSNFMLTLISS